MRVSDDHRVLFVHVPKTGGSTIEVIFDDEVADSRRVAGARRHTDYQQLTQFDPVVADYWACGFVRNPWARMLSWWAMAVDMQERVDRGAERAVRKVTRYPEIWAPLMQYGDDFERFVLAGTQEVPRLARPQIDYLTAGERKVDFVGRVERFVDDVNVVRARLGLAPVESLPRKNKSKHGHYRDYYNDAMRERVAQVYAADIEAFGYEY